MTTFLVTLALFAAVVSAMALGVALTGRRLRGSCGFTGEDCACSVWEARRCRQRGT